MTKKEELTKLLLSMADDMFKDNNDNTESTDSNTKSNESSGTKCKVYDIRTREELANKLWSDKTDDEKFCDISDAMEDLTKTTCDEFVDDDFLNNATEDVVKALKCYGTDKQVKHQRMAYNSKKTDKHLENKSMYMRDTAQVAGEQFKYTGYKEIPKWGMELQSCLTNNDKELNLNQLRTKITEEFINYFGGFKNIRSIVIHSNQVIINKVMYVPVLNSAILSKMPFDCAEYIKGGYLAPFIDWGYIGKCTGLTLLSFDNVDYIMQYVAIDLGYGRGFKPLKLFEICRNLQTLDVEGNVVHYPFEESNGDSESALNIENECRYYDKFDKIYDVYTKNVSNNLGSVRKWTVNNLVNYANNRGKKGIFSYSLGLLGRTVAFAGAGTAELGSRTIGGIFKGVTGIIRNAVSEVDVKDTRAGR